MFELIWRLHDEERLAGIPKNLPMFFVAGAEDPVGNYGKGVKQAADTVRKVGVQDVTMKLYPGGRHEILNDREHGEVMRMCFLSMKKFWQKQYKWIVILGLVMITPAMTVWADETGAVQESVEDLPVSETETAQEETDVFSQMGELIPTEEITQTLTDTGEELVEQIGEEVKEKAKEVKHNVLLTLWEHIKQMFHDFFAAIFGEKE